jgi:hypothetical protein
MNLAKCNWCGKNFENYVFSLGYCSNKCKQEKKHFFEQKKHQNNSSNLKSDFSSNKIIDPNQTLYDENGSAYTSEVSKLYGSSEEAQKAEKKQRFVVAVVGLSITFIGIPLCYASPILGIPISLIGILIYALSKARIVL